MNSPETTEEPTEQEWPKESEEAGYHAKDSVQQ